MSLSQPEISQHCDWILWLPVCLGWNFIYAFPLLRVTMQAFIKALPMRVLLLNNCGTYFSFPDQVTLRDLLIQK